MTTRQTLEAAVLGWINARLGKYRYGNSWSVKFDPDRTGITDCSGTAYRLYMDIMGIDIGRMSYNQAEAGREIASGTTVAQFQRIAGNLRAGDLIVMARRSGYGGGRDYNHVEISTGPGVQTAGHGGYPPMGPNLHPVTLSYLLGDAAKWTVRRIIPAAPITEKKDDMDAKQAAQLSQIHTWLKTLDLTESKVDQLYKRRAKIDAINTMQGQIEAIGKAVDQLAAGQSLDMSAITAAAEKGAREGSAAIAADDVADLLEVRPKGDS